MDKIKKIDHAAEIEALVREIREFVWAKVDEVISHVLEIQDWEDDSITTNDDEQVAGDHQRRGKVRTMPVTKEEMHQVLERIQSLLDLALEASAIQDCWPSEVHAWQEVHDAGEMYSEACHMAEVEFAALMARI